MATTTEMRCPVDSQRMFGKIVGDYQPSINENLVEFACDKCRRGTSYRLVLHRFDLSGQFVETRTVA